MGTRRVLRVFIGTGLVAVTVTGVWLLVGPLSVWVTGPNLASLDAKDQVAAVGNTRGQLLAVVTGLTVLGGLIYTVRSYRLAKEGQVTDRFSKAVGHLESDDETVRAGGIRALDRIMADSVRDHDRILESVTGFLRNRAIATDATSRRRLTDDVSAALTTLRLRPRRPERESLDVAGIHVPGANLRGANLTGADLTGADLTGANLVNCDLTNAVLHSVILTGARLDKGQLTQANARNADFTEASLTGATLTRADLAGSNLERTNLDNADLSGATLKKARFAGATVAGCRMHNADLTQADLRGVDLGAALGLTTPQLLLARTDTHTRVPPGIDHPATPRPAG